MSDQQRLASYVEIWKRAVDDFVRLARSIPADQWDAPTDLAGWSVKDNVAHTAHLEAVLAGAPEETVQVGEQPHIKSLTGLYTEQGVVARRGRDMESLAKEIEESAAIRYAALQADPPTDGRADPPRTPGGVPWNNQTLLSNRPLDVWMHEQDIRRAIDRPGGFDSPAATHVIGVLSRALPMVVGKRVQPPAGTTVALRIPDAGVQTAVTVGDDGRAAPAADDAQPDVTISMAPAAFVVAAGGRGTPDPDGITIRGDRELGQRVVAHLAVTP